MKLFNPNLKKYHADTKKIHTGKFHSFTFDETLNFQLSYRTLPNLFFFFYERIWFLYIIFKRKHKSHQKAKLHHNFKNSNHDITFQSKRQKSTIQSKSRKKSPHNIFWIMIVALLTFFEYWLSSWQTDLCAILQKQSIFIK